MHLVSGETVNKRLRSDDGRLARLDTRPDPLPLTLFVADFQNEIAIVTQAHDGRDAIPGVGTKVGLDVLPRVVAEVEVETPHDAEMTV